MTTFTDKELEKMLADATPGPWKSKKSVHGNQYRYVEIGGPDGSTTLEQKPADARLLAAAPDLARALLEARKEVARLERLVYVPGVWRCAKCKLVLISTNLHADSGLMSPDNSPQQCANGCGPMWRKTERDAGNELIDQMDALQAKMDKVREIADEQAEDERLWFIPQYITEDGLQWALRRLHEAIEGKTADECAATILGAQHDE